MSPRTAAGAGASGAGRAGLLGLLVVVIALGLFLLARATPSPGAFDPRSNRPDGARALVLLLEDQGASVDVSRAVPPPDALQDVAPRVLVLEDRLSDAQREALAAYATAGGVVVVADPASGLHGGAGIDDGAVRVDEDAPLHADVGTRPDAANNVRNRSCSIAALARLRGLYVDDGILFPVTGQPSCFGDGQGASEGNRHAFAIRREVGDGAIVGLGDNHVLTNRWLRFADNSALAVALLVPDEGARVTIVLGTGAPRSVDDVGTGDESLRDLVRPGVWMALLQLAVAFVVFAAARGIRVGRPTVEPRPVPLAGSELVRATGSLMRVARHHERAAWMLVMELHRDLCRRYRIDHASSVDQVAWTAHDRDGIDPAITRRALAVDPDAVTDDAALLDLARAVDAVRAHIAGADAPVPEGATT